MADYVNIIPVMTSNTAPSGVASGSARYNTAFDYFRAFNNNDSSVWSTPASTDTGWIQYEFDTAETVLGYGMVAPSTSLDGMANTWTLLASNTGAFSGEEVTLDSQSGVTWTYTGSKVIKQYLFTNSTAYLYYRVNITLNNGNDRVYFGDLEMYDTIPPEADFSGSATLTSGPIGFASFSSSSSLSAEGEIRTNFYEFLFVESLELSKILKTFNFVEKIEQIPSATIIKRINS